jgi:hypothetical protein
VATELRGEAEYGAQDDARKGALGVCAVHSCRGRQADGFVPDVQTVGRGGEDWDGELGVDHGWDQRWDEDGVRRHNENEDGKTALDETILR